MRWRIVVLLAFTSLMAVGFAVGDVEHVSAHATLIRSKPAANAALAQSPQEIRLWFSEIVEPKFSSFTLVDANGTTVSTPVSQADPADATQLFMRPDKLPDGLYTVVWHTVSAADGHSLNGNFPFTIGAVGIVQNGVPQPAEQIPPDGTFIRWLNLLAMSLAMGSSAFVLFVWTPSVNSLQPAIERRMNRLILIGWVLLGIASALALLLQVSLAVQVSLLSAITHPALGQVITETRYGTLWSIRMALWLIFGVELYLAAARHDRRFYWIALIFGGGILLTNSLYSHASAAQDSTAAVLNDWLHLLMTALWIGGLFQFINVIQPVRKTMKGSTATISTLVSHFSNYARVAVAALFITGLYSAWLQVGSIDALFTTLYGKVLLVKLVLIVPLLALAAINLVLTYRGLESGQAIWVGRLRGLVSAEIVLTVGILVAVGAMTSLEPSRDALAQQVSVPPPAPIVASQTADDLNIQLAISPGWIGENTFTVTLTDQQGNPVKDASLLRLKFDDQTQTLGQSELRIQHGDKGVYTVQGSNLSLPGDWRLRLTVQRPGKYDEVVDFTSQVSAAPTTPPSELNAPIPLRLPALLLTGLVALGVGGFFASRSRFLSGAGLLSRGLAGVGLVFLTSTAITFANENSVRQTQAAGSSTATACAGVQVASTGVIIPVEGSSTTSSIRIAKPTDGDTIKGNQINIQVATTNLAIDQQQHLHTYLDGKLASMDYATSLSLNNVAPGIHDICVVVGDSAHTDTPLRDGIHVVVEAP
ncbi:MAG: FixH family protein [Chloroflexota bacterium]